MGKALVIKGADFSASSVRKVALDGKTYLDISTAAFILEGYFVTDTQWRTYAGVFYCFWPVHAGDYVFVQTTPERDVRFIFASFANGLPSVQLANNYIGQGQSGAILMKATQDCYLGWLAKKETETSMAEIPAGAFIQAGEYFEYPVPTEDNYTIYANKYITNAGAWGAGDTTEMYNIAKGDTFVVDNRDGTGLCRVGILNEFPAGDENRLASGVFGALYTLSTGSNVVDIAAGTMMAEAIAAPVAGVLCVCNFGAFPETLISKVSQ